MSRSGHLLTKNIDARIYMQGSGLHINGLVGVPQGFGMNEAAVNVMQRDGAEVASVGLNKPQMHYSKR